MSTGERANASPLERGDVFSADLAGMLRWAEGIMASRPPDFVIGERHIRRWWAIPRNNLCNVYLHEMLASDDDRALHDHPWPNTSALLFGSYIEHTPGGAFVRVAGEVIERPAHALHRLELPEGVERVISLFVTGPKVREWGFACPQGWVHWRDFSDPAEVGRAGRGCGEHDDPTPVTEPGHTREREDA